VDFWGSTNALLFSETFFTCLQSLHTSLALWDCQPSACIGGGKTAETTIKSKEKRWVSVQQKSTKRLFAVTLHCREIKITSSSGSQVLGAMKAVWDLQLGVEPAERASF